MGIAPAICNSVFHVIKDYMARISAAVADTSLDTKPVRLVKDSFLQGANVTSLDKAERVWMGIEMLIFIHLT